MIKASSEYTFALALNFDKKISIAEKYVKKGFWRNIEDKLRSDELFKKVGIIGLEELEKYFELFKCFWDAIYNLRSKYKKIIIIQLKT